MTVKGFTGVQQGPHDAKDGELKLEMTAFMFRCATLRHAA